MFRLFFMECLFLLWIQSQPKVLEMEEQEWPR